MTNKQEKFTSLAEKRVNVVLNQLRLIGNLADNRYYEYTDNQATQITRSIRKALSEIENKFKSNNKSETNKFSFKS